MTDEQPPPRWRWALARVGIFLDVITYGPDFDHNRPIRLAHDWGLISTAEFQWRHVRHDPWGLPEQCYRWPR